MTTYGSAIFAEHVPDRTASAVARLEEAGYAVVGKTNLHEFAYGITSENEHFGDVANPLAEDRYPGGSSGGSAAALAAGLCDAALGTDSAGSIRIPAACCGVVGFKPTHGLVPMDGCWPLAPSFDTAGSHNMTRVARFESYRGFLFGSLNEDVSTLAEHLGDTTKVIDMLVDQSPDGLEVLRGSSTYTYDGNWKVQAENGADGYHVTAVHWNYAATTARRSAGDSANKTKAMDAGKWGKVKGGFYSYDHGHLLLWQEWTNPQDRPLWDRRDELVAKYGEEMANFMINISRNLCLYPNVYIMDQFSSQIRHFRPISADQTEVTIYCIAPKGESQENRSKRIRQYEDFFNATGMATPDDLEEFRSCNKTYWATSAPWNDMTRGSTHEIAGPDEQAQALGMTKVIASGVRTEDEGLYPIQHGYWKEVMDRALAEEEERSALDAVPVTA